MIVFIKFVAENYIFSAGILGVEGQETSKCHRIAPWPRLTRIINQFWPQTQPSPALFVTLNKLWLSLKKTLPETTRWGMVHLVSFRNSLQEQFLRLPTEKLRILWSISDQIFFLFQIWQILKPFLSKQRAARWYWKLIAIIVFFVF